MQLTPEEQQRFLSAVAHPRNASLITATEKALKRLKITAIVFLSLIAASVFIGIFFTLYALFATILLLCFTLPTLISYPKMRKSYIKELDKLTFALSDNKINYATYKQMQSLPTHYSTQSQVQAQSHPTAKAPPVTAENTQPTHTTQTLTVKETPAINTFVEKPKKAKSNANLKRYTRFIHIFTIAGWAAILLLFICYLIPFITLDGAIVEYNVSVFEFMFASAQSVEVDVNGSFDAVMDALDKSMKNGMLVETMADFFGMHVDEYTGIFGGLFNYDNFPQADGFIAVGYAFNKIFSFLSIFIFVVLVFLSVWFICKTLFTKKRDISSVSHDDFIAALSPAERALMEQLLEDTRKNANRGKQVFAFIMGLIGWIVLAFILIRFPYNFFTYLSAQAPTISGGEFMLGLTFFFVSAFVALQTAGSFVTMKYNIEKQKEHAQGNVFISFLNQ